MEIHTRVLGAGIGAVSQGGSATIANTGVISADWGTSAGIQLGGTTQSLGNSGTVGALSDVALRGDSGGFGGVFDILNAGRLTGVVTASASTVSVDNTGT